MPGPLHGVRVIDLTHVLNGPFSTMLLAHMGAEVIKIEHGPGDRFRHAWMPIDADHDGYEFLWVNSNKKCITLDLKHPRGKELFRELVKRADIVVENFTVGVMDRLGLGYEALREINPRIIYASSKGYGESGPYKHMRANASTIMSITGWTNAAWEFSGVRGGKSQGIGDEAAGVSMALGMIAALYAREQTGLGQKIEVAMQEALLGFMVSSLHTLFERQPIGGVPKQCADGYVGFHLPDITDQLWESFAEAMGHPEAVTDPRFATPQARRANYHEVEQLVTDWVRSTTRAELWRIFRSIGISSAPVLSLAEAIEDEHLQARGAFAEVDHPRAGRLKLLKPWIRFSQTPSSLEHAGPAMGEHNREVYGQLLGLTEGEIQALADQGVI
jgi:crotonobetainyl-CoA:carnitine CoA-transferase CaiB-like acyl-CoA transferase